MHSHLLLGARLLDTPLNHLALPCMDRDLEHTLQSVPPSPQRALHIHQRVLPIHQPARLTLQPVLPIHRLALHIHRQVPHTLQRVLPIPRLVPHTHQRVPHTHRQVRHTHQRVRHTHQLARHTHRRAPPTHPQARPTRWTMMKVLIPSDKRRRIIGTRSSCTRDIAFYIAAAGFHIQLYSIPSFTVYMLRQKGHNVSRAFG